MKGDASEMHKILGEGQKQAGEKDLIVEQSRSR